MNLTGWEDGGIGALIVAVVWAVWSWMKSRHPKPKGQYEK